MEDRDIMLTEEGYKKLVDELQYLKGPRKMEVAERIKIAREFGDLSENSEYEEAKNEQAQKAKQPTIVQAQTMLPQPGMSSFLAR